MEHFELERFKPGYEIPDQLSEKLRWFIVDNDDIYVYYQDGRYIIPLLGISEIEQFEFENISYLGQLDGVDIIASTLKENSNSNGLVKEKLRTLIMANMPMEDFWLASKALQVVRWDSETQFCSKCSSSLENKRDERAKVCTECETVYYPRLSPSMIVAVVKDDQLLLARATKFTSKLYSVLAGFVEQGESLEDCVRREVFEEVGIKVKNIKYFASQSWPFPDALMIGFTAEYVSGEIVIDPDEIVDAQWYTVDEIPEFPNRVSIASRLIEWFIEDQKS
jgi:NAD+ diphosphatase